MQQPNKIQWTTIAAALPQPITLLVKNALLLFYLRIFRPNALVRYGIYFGLVVITCMYISFMFVFIFITAFQAQTGQRLSWAQASFNLVSDVYILILPISGVVRLHVSLKRKMGVLFIFSTGLAYVHKSGLQRRLLTRLGPSLLVP
jgi:hypothetical protein